MVRPESGEALVQIRGPRRLLLDQVEGVSAWVDLEGLEVGRHRLELETSAPPHLDVIESNPAYVVVRLKPASPKATATR